MSQGSCLGLTSPVVMPWCAFQCTGAGAVRKVEELVKLFVERPDVTDQELVLNFTFLFYLLFASHHQHRVASTSSHVPLCHITPVDPMWLDITWHDRLRPLVLAMTQVGAVLAVTHIMSFLLLVWLIPLIVEQWLTWDIFHSLLSSSHTTHSFYC